MSKRFTAGPLLALLALGITPVAQANGSATPVLLEPEFVQASAFILPESCEEPLFFVGVTGVGSSESSRGTKTSSATIELIFAMQIGCPQSSLFAFPGPVSVNPDQVFVK